MDEEITYEPIGVVRSPFATPDDVPKHPKDTVDATGTVELHEVYAEGLARVNGFSHLKLVTYLHEVEDITDLRCDPPFAPGIRPGIFATRGTGRPNPIGCRWSPCSVVKGQRSKWARSTSWTGRYCST